MLITSLGLYFTTPLKSKTVSDRNDTPQHKNTLNKRMRRRLQEAPAVVL